MTLIEALKSGKKHRVVGSNTGWYAPLISSAYSYSCHDILADWEVEREPRELMLYNMHDGTIQAVIDASKLVASGKQPEFICRVREILG